ncbi:MAG: helix-hairpin-helix domain-containing protein [Blastocatellia bacterium]
MSKAVSSPNENAPADPPAGLNDDFSQIKGIGQSMAQGLYKLGFTKFADLAKHTPEDLANLLKLKGLTISPQRIERDDWIGQAQALVSGTAATEPKKRSFETPWTKAEDWHEMADFFVSFGYLITKDGEKRLTTRAAPSLSGEGHKDWDGIAGDQLVEWLLQHADLPASHETEPKTGGSGSNGASSHQAAPADSAAAEMSIRNMVEAQMASGIRGLSLSSVIRVEGCYTLPASARALTAQYLYFSVEAYLIDLQHDQHQLAASHIGRLQPGVMSYSVLLDLPKPPSGRYQLYLVSQLLDTGDAAARVKGPTLRIEH